MKNDKDEDVNLGRKLFRLMQDEKKITKENKMVDRVAIRAVALLITLILIALGMHMAGVF